MAKYRVYLTAVASTTVEVEASDGDEAVEVALSTPLPHPPAFAGYDFGEWATASDLFPQFNKPEDDYELI